VCTAHSIRAILIALVENARVFANNHGRVENASIYEEVCVGLDLHIGCKTCKEYCWVGRNYTHWYTDTIAWFLTNHETHDNKHDLFFFNDDGLFKCGFPGSVSDFKYIERGEDD